MSEKKYVNGIWIKEIPTSYDSLISISFSENCLNELLQNPNNGNQTKITIYKRKEKDQYGNTHYAVYDNYQPKIAERPPILTNNPKAVIKNNPETDPGTNPDLPF